MWLCGARSSPATLGLAGYRDFQCPSGFDRFPVAKAWFRIDREGGPDLTSDELLPGVELEDISRSTGAFIRQNKARRIIYIGASSSKTVDAVIKKLDTIFDYHVRITRPPFLLWACLA